MPSSILQAVYSRYIPSFIPMRDQISRNCSHYVGLKRGAHPVDAGTRHFAVDPRPRRRWAWDWLASQDYGRRASSGSKQLLSSERVFRAVSVCWRRTEGVRPSSERQAAASRDLFRVGAVQKFRAQVKYPRGPHADTVAMHTVQYNPYSINTARAEEDLTCAPGQADRAVWSALSNVTGVWLPMPSSCQRPNGGKDGAVNAMRTSFRRQIPRIPKAETWRPVCPVVVSTLTGPSALQCAKIAASRSICQLDLGTHPDSC